MGATYLEDYEDQDYRRYYNLYGEPAYTEEKEDDEWEDAEALLADDAISGGEEGFLRGYERAVGQPRLR